MRAAQSYGERALAVVGIIALAIFALLAACTSDTTGPERVARVTVAANGNKTQLLVGEQVQLTATVLDRDGTPITGRSITFRSSNDAVASVGASSGLVTAVSAGSARITAVVDGVSGAVDLGVLPPVASVSVTPATLVLHPQWTEPLTVTLRDAAGLLLGNRVVTYASSDENIAKVSASGVVTGAGTGNATITVTSEGQTATLAISVTNAPVHAVTILPGSANIPDGIELQFSVALADARGFNLSRPVTWSSSSNAVATISGTGRAVGVAPGTTDITASSEGTSASVPLIVRARVATILVTPPDTVLRTGDELQLAVTLLDKNGVALSGRVITFTPFAGIAVSDGGVIRALEPATGNIVVRSEGREALVPLRVIERVMFVEVTPVFATVPVGSQTQLIVTLRDRAGKVLTDRIVGYSSANDAIATVSPAGLVTGVAKGVATITVTSEGVTKTAQITVP